MRRPITQHKNHFSGGVAPLLKVTGRSLVVLNIMCLNLVQVSTLAEFCPYLKSLTISNHCGRVTDLPASERDYFQIERNRNKQSIFKELKYFFSSYDVFFFFCLLLHLKTPAFMTVTPSLMMCYRKPQN